MTTTPSTDPLAALDSNHPHYDAMNTDKRWKRWRAVLDGFDTDEAKKEFLPKTEVELDADYEHRIKISEFLGVTGGAINRLTGAVFGVPARIEPKNALVLEFLKDVDGLRTSIADFMESVSRESQGMGISYVGVDRTQAIPGTATKAAETATMRVFLTRYGAEEVVNWGLDQNGGLDWVNIRRIISEQGSPLGAAKYFREARVLTKKTITIYRKEVKSTNADLDKPDQWKVHQEPIDHKLERVPLEPFYGERADSMRGKSIHAGVMNADIAKFNEESWGAMDRYRHANQLLVIQSTKALKDIVTGPAFRLQQGEDVKYVSPSGTAFEAREKAIDRLRREGISQSGTNANGTADSGSSTTGESGIAMRVRFTHTEKRAIDHHSRWMESGITNVLMLVEHVITGKAPSEPPTVSFFSTFEVFELSEIMANYKTSQYWIRSPRWHQEMLKLIATKSLPDMGEDVKKAILAEVEKQKIADVPDPGISENFGA